MIDRCLAEWDILGYGFQLIESGECISDVSWVDKNLILAKSFEEGSFMTQVLTDLMYNEYGWRWKASSLELLTVNGVSLTINAVHSRTIPEVHLMLIPHTLEITNLKNVKPNDHINIEFDHYAKTIAHQLSHYLQHREITHVL